MPAKTPPVSDYQAQREKELAEYLALSAWYTDAVDAAILAATEDFTSSAKAHAYARQTAKKSNPKKFDRLRELEVKHPRFLV